MRDQRERLKDREGAVNLTEIRVTIDKESGIISIQNNGDSIKVEKHSSGLYNPNLIFGRLLTSGNYKKGEKRTVGGKNGYGAKIVNIFSDSFGCRSCGPIYKAEVYTTLSQQHERR